MMNYLDNEIKIIKQKKLEKIIKGLEECLSASCRGFKPGIYCPMPDEVWNNVRDALALLKAQEPVKPTLDIRHGKSMWRCGSCSTALQPNQIHAKFCFNCGQAVKWE